MQSSKVSRIEAFYADLFRATEHRFPPDRDTAPPFHQWVAETVALDGKPFDFTDHEYLRGPYADPHPYQIFQKATQLGCTTLAILRAVYGARYRGFKGVLYLFPGLYDALDFSKSRVTPLIQDNPDTIGTWIRETDSAGLKQLWNGFLFLRGMRSRAGLKSVPIDFLVCDELDESPQASLKLAFERMAHSIHKEILMLSNPTLPDFGINKEFQQTDQRFWLLKCPSCGEYTDLVESFPDCLVERGGRVIRACVKCGAELDPSRGEWVAKHPNVRDRRGFQFSQLHSHYVNPGEILREFRSTDNLQEFHNLKLGLPYIEAENRLSVEEVLALCGDYPNATEDPGPCSLGCDQGKDLHVVIGRRDPLGDKAGKIVHIGVYSSWEDLDGLMKRFHVARAVVDGLPEQRAARAFAEQHRGRVHLCFYQQHRKGEPLWSDKDWTLSVDRTESLDTSTHQLQQGRVIPRGCATR